MCSSHVKINRRGKINMLTYQFTWLAVFCQHFSLTLFAATVIFFNILQSSPHYNNKHTYCALPVSAVLASSVWDGVEVNEVIMRSNCQQTTICRHTERSILGHVVQFWHNAVMETGCFFQLVCKLDDVTWVHPPTEKRITDSCSFPSVWIATRSVVSASRTYHLRQVDQLRLWCTCRAIN